MFIQQNHINANNSFSGILSISIMLHCKNYEYFSNVWPMKENFKLLIEDKLQMEREWMFEIIHVPIK